MTNDIDDLDTDEQIAWEPKTPREQREPLRNAPLATLRATPGSQTAVDVMLDLATRFPRPQAAKGKGYARKKTLPRLPRADHSQHRGWYKVDPDALGYAAATANRRASSNQHPQHVVTALAWLADA